MTDPAAVREPSFRKPNHPSGVAVRRTASKKQEDYSNQRSAVFHGLHETLTEKMTCNMGSVQAVRGYLLLQRGLPRHNIQRTPGVRQ